MNSDWVNPDLRGHRHHHLQPHQQHDQHQQSRQLSSNMTHTIRFVIVVKTLEFSFKTIKLFAVFIYN